MARDCRDWLRGQEENVRMKRVLADGPYDLIESKLQFPRWELHKASHQGEE